MNHDLQYLKYKELYVSRHVCFIYKVYVPVRLFEIFTRTTYKHADGISGKDPSQRHSITKTPAVELFSEKRRKSTRQSMVLLCAESMASSNFPNSPTLHFSIMRSYKTSIEYAKMALFRCSDVINSVEIPCAPRCRFISTMYINIFSYIDLFLFVRKNMLFSIN